jgi:hypothetical protein
MQLFQFSPHPGGRNESNRIKQVCGSLSRGDDLNESRGLIGPRTFYNPKGSVKLEVHVDPDTDYETEIGAEIALTAYTSMRKQIYEFIFPHPQLMCV